MAVHGASAVPERGHWYQDIYCQHHYDAHHGGYEKVYQEFDADRAAQSFAEAGAQMVCYFAKGACSTYRALSPLQPDLAIINNWAWMSQYSVTPSPHAQHLTFDAEPLAIHSVYRIELQP